MSKLGVIVELQSQEEFNDSERQFVSNDPIAVMSSPVQTPSRKASSISSRSDYNKLLQPTTLKKINLNDNDDVIHSGASEQSNPDLIIISEGASMPLNPDLINFSEAGEVIQNGRNFRSIPMPQINGQMVTKLNDLGEINFDIASQLSQPSLIILEAGEGIALKVK